MVPSSNSTALTMVAIGDSPKRLVVAYVDEFLNRITDSFFDHSALLDISGKFVAYKSDYFIIA